MRREVLATLFFAAATAGMTAAILTSHPSGSDVGWLIGGALLGADSGIRLARNDHRRRTTEARPPSKQRVRAVATFAAGLGVFLNAVLPRQPWLAIFAYGAVASLIATAYYGWCAVTVRHR